MTEYYIGGGIADLVYMTRAGYLTEVEIKVTLSDLKADKKKRKWLYPRQSVARFFYAVPETLADRIPDDLPADAGIIVVRAGDRCDQAVEIRPAKRRKAKKMEDRQKIYFLERAYFRFWYREIDRLRAWRAK